MKKNREIIKNIVVDALFIAFIALFTFVPYLGFINLGIITITTIHLFVTLAAAVYGWKKGLLMGFIFGLASLIRATYGQNPFDLLFINPFVSVLPRTLFGLLSGLAFDFVKKNLTYKQYYAVMPFVACLMTVVHSLLTLGCAYLFGCLDIFNISKGLLDLGDFISKYNLANFGSYCLYIGLLTLFGALGEAVFSALTTPLCYFALTQIPSIKEEEERKFKAIEVNNNENNDNI